MDELQVINKWRQQERSETEKTKLQELAWLEITDGPPTCTSSVAINTATQLQSMLFIGCSNSVWVVHAPQPDFQPDSLEASKIPLEGMPGRDSGLRVSSLTTVVSDSPDKSAAIAVALCRSDSARADGCGVMVYGSGLNVDCNVMDIGTHKQWLPSSEPPIVLKPFSYIFPLEPSKIGQGTSDLLAPKNALLVFGSSGSISAYVRSPSDEFSSVPEIELGCLPEIEVLSDAGPFSSMDVRYVFFQRHVAAGGLRGAIVYTCVDVTSGTLLSSRRITIEGPITSCLLFSSSRHLDAAQIPPPDLAVGVFRSTLGVAMAQPSRLNASRTLLKELMSGSSSGSSSGFDSSDSEESKKEEDIGSDIDAHLTVTSALGYAVLYPNVDKSGFAGGAPLQGMQGGERDSCLSVCTGDLDLDGKAELLVGTYGGAVVHYPLASPSEEAATGDENEGLFFEGLPYSASATPESIPNSPVYSPLTEPQMVTATTMQSEILRPRSPYPNQDNTAKSPISSPRSPRNATLLDPKSRFAALGGSGTSLRGMASVSGGGEETERRESGKHQLNSASAGNAAFKPIEKWASFPAQVDQGTNVADRAKLDSPSITPSTAKSTIESIKAGLVRAISGEHRRAEDRTDESDARRTISPDSSDRHRTPGHASNSNIPNSPDTNIRPFNPSSTMLEENYIKSPRRGQGQGSIRSLVEGGGHHESPEARSMSPLRPSSALARSLHPNESSAKSFSTVASSRKNSGWIKSQNEESKFTKYPSTWEAGGAVYGMHWVDLTSAGIRELALVLHNGIRILQPDHHHATERLKTGMDQLLHLRELENKADPSLQAEDVQLPTPTSVPSDESELGSDTPQSDPALTPQGRPGRALPGGRAKMWA